MATYAKAKTGPGKAQKKGGTGGGRHTAPGSAKKTSNRYTPPIPKSTRTSPRWMGFAVIALFLVGVLVVILDYAGLMPGGVSNLWLIAAIASIFAGLLLATRYH